MPYRFQSLILTAKRLYELISIMLKYLGHFYV